MIESYSQLLTFAAVVTVVAGASPICRHSKLQEHKMSHHEPHQDGDGNHHLRPGMCRGRKAHRDSPKCGESVPEARAARLQHLH